MLRSVFLKSLRDQRQPLVWWSLGLATLALVTVAFYPSIGSAPELERLLEESPEPLRVFIGEVESLTSPEGYLESQLFFFMFPLLFLVFAIGLGSGAIASEEQRGTLDLLLSTPLARWQPVVEKFGAMAAATLVLGLASWAALAVGIRAVEMDVGVGRVAEATLSLALLAVVYGTLALAVGCASGKRGVSIGIAGALGVAAYFLNALAPMVEALQPYRQLSPFYYYIALDPLTTGLDPGHMAVLLGMTLALLAVAVLAFDRRDLGV